MMVEYHPAVQRDVEGALQRYRSVSELLCGEFKAELRRAITNAATNPKRFHTIKPGVHRVNLKRFPYHFIYQEIENGIRVILVKHNRRHPELGMGRV